MQERQVTIGDQTFALPDPFLVMATQNPVEQEGTYPLPEAQSDRFLLKVVMDYPQKSEELDIIRLNMLQEFPRVNVVVHKDQIMHARIVVRSLYMDEKIERYIVDLVHASRDPQGNGIQGLKELISFGASPRASISLALASKAYAFLQGRGYVIPEDVRAIAKDVLRHRIGLTYEAEAEEMSSDDVVDSLLNKVLVP
jgi:MoxR-like ATPase